MRKGSKRVPRFASREEALRYSLTSKAQLWAAYRDLYQQTYGEDRNFVADIRPRLLVLKQNGLLP